MRMKFFIFTIALILADSVLASPPPFTGGTLSHQDHGWDFAAGVHACQYDTNGLFDQTTGTIYHNGIAESHIYGTGQAHVTDEASIPFSVTTSGNYVVQIGGQVSGNAYSIGYTWQGTDWGDLNVSMQALRIFDPTDTAPLYGSPSITLFQQEASIWEIYTPIGEQLIENAVDAFSVAGAAGDIITASEKAVEIANDVQSIATAKSNISLAFLY